MTRGERLLKTIYETIRNSPHWENSVLIITYDEHGGFYDHVAPPQTVAPGDATTDPANDLYHFDFRQLGVRVPAVIVSPLIPKGLIDSTIYDHTSVLATVESIFGLQPLTERDTQAHTLNHLFSLATPRTDAPTTLPAPAESGIKCPGDPGASAARMLLVTPDAALATEPVPASLQGFLHVAFLRDVQASPPEEYASRMARYLRIKTHLEAQHYMDEVRQKVEPPEAEIRSDLFVRQHCWLECDDLTFSQRDEVLVHHWCRDDQARDAPALPPEK